MKRTLIIHIGWHKTATTTIQDFFHLHRGKLLKHDICYPVIGRAPGIKVRKQQFLVLCIPEDDKWVNPRSDLPTGDEAFQIALDEMLNSKCCYSVISAEGLSQPDTAQVKFMGRFKQYFDDVKIVAFVRRQDYFLESIYAQRV